VACENKGFPVAFDRYGFHNRVKQELAHGRWSDLVGKSSAWLGGFVTLGSSPPAPPTWLGAAAEGSYLSQPPSNPTRMPRAAPPQPAPLLVKMPSRRRSRSWSYHASSAHC
jgi:hypothetical protein